MKKREIATGIIATHIADHLPTFVFIKNRERKKHQSKHKTMKIREMKLENKETVKKAIEKEKWEEIKAEHNVNRKTIMFQETIEKIYDESFPEKEVKLNKNIHAKETFMTRGLLISRGHGKKLFQKWIKSQDNDKYQQYSDYDSLYRKLVRLSKTMEADKLYKENYKNTRKILEITNKMLNRKKKGKCEIVEIYSNEHQTETTSNKQNMANKFNEFFVSFGPKIANTFSTDTNNFEKHLPPPTKTVMSIRKLGPQEIEDLIGTLKNKNSAGFD